MILPVQQLAVRTWLEGALADAGKPIPLERLVWSNQDSASLARPYALIFPTGAVSIGTAPERRGEAGGGLRSTSQGQSTISITIVGQVNRTSLDDGASAYMLELGPRLQVPDLDQPLRDAGLSVAGFSELPSLDRLTGQSQWETRAALDVTFNGAILVTTTPGDVATAVITGTTDPPTPIGTFEVPPPA